MKIAVVVGNVAVEPTLRISEANGTKYVNLSVISNSGFGDNKKSTFTQYVFFNDAAEGIINAKVKKGSSLVVIGEDEENQHYVKNEENHTLTKGRGLSWRYNPAGKSTSNAKSDTPPPAPGAQPPSQAATPAQSATPAQTASVNTQAAPAQQGAPATPVDQNAVQAAVDQQLPMPDDAVMALAQAAISAGVAGTTALPEDVPDLPF